MPAGRNKTRSPIRKARRKPAAFGFYFRRPGRPTPAAGWMLERSRHQGIFIAEPGDAPAVGERIELAVIPSDDPCIQAESAGLAPMARVERVDECGQPTHRFLVRFEKRPTGNLTALTRNLLAAARRLARELQAARAS